MSTPPTSAGRFAPGEVIAERYRIVALLGRGGMGEVYRADDLKLGVAVAIKFLPEALEADTDLRQRFLSEVRLARQVAHPNVCRTYDLGEVAGRYYLTMEYVDGEDLASLLRRVGRMAGDRAVEVARQIAAGLAAAHEQGILHRDLKPANILIDGRGRARLTDFGLAGFADGGGARGGTPAYMAPEQLAGGDASVKSDLYALGLIFYELFTGRPAFDPATPVGMLARERQHSTPVTPASLVSDLPPAVERVIQRCLAADPTQRPTSALSVAAALPGGDPLAAAIAAGETPSPELLAEAGSREGLSRRGAWMAFAAFALALVVALALAPRTQLTSLVQLPRSNDVLRDRATQIATNLGYPGPFRDRDGAWQVENGITRWIAARDSSPDRWQRMRGPEGQWLLGYWWRMSPRPLAPLNMIRTVSSPNDPPLDYPGEVLVAVSAQGRLRRLIGVPPDRADSLAAPAAAPWSPALVEAGFDTTALLAVAPQWQPPVFADERRAWTGVEPESKLPVRIEAAAFRGTLVSFRIVRPWSESVATPPRKTWAESAPVQVVVFLLLLSVVGGAILLARRNLNEGRGDRRGALRIGMVSFLLASISILAARHYLPASAQLVNLLIVVLGTPLAVAVLFGLMYLALEPSLRRLFPDLFVSWVRALDLRFHDPLVARDLLFGLVAGAGLMALQRLTVVAAAALRVPMSTPDPTGSLGTEAFSLNGWRALVAQVCDASATGLQQTLVLMLITMLSSFRIQRRWITITIVTTTMLFVSSASMAGSVFELLFGLVWVALFIVALFRLGPFATFVLGASSEVLRTIATPLDSSSWYFRGTPVAVLALAVPAVLALRASLRAHDPVRRVIPTGFAGPSSRASQAPAPTSPRAWPVAADSPTVPYAPGASTPTTPDTPTLPDLPPGPSSR